MSNVPQFALVCESMRYSSFPGPWCVAAASPRSTSWLAPRRLLRTLEPSVCPDVAVEPDDEHIDCSGSGDAAHRAMCVTFSLTVHEISLAPCRCSVRTTAAADTNTGSAGPDRRGICVVESIDDRWNFIARCMLPQQPNLLRGFGRNSACTALIGVTLLNSMQTHLYADSGRNLRGNLWAYE